MTNTLEGVRQILAEKYSIPVDTITKDSTLESLKLDSLDLVEVLFEVEDRFHIRMPEDRKGDVNMTTVQHIAELIDRLRAEQMPAQVAGAGSS